jgi:hypothetical protein
MSTARRKTIITPRILRRSEIATYLNHSETWFSTQRERLEALGFPRFISTLDGYDKAAVDHWLDRMSGLIAESEATGFSADAWSKAAQHGEL